MAGSFLANLQTWDSSSQIALGTAVTLLIIVLLALFFGPPDLKQPALIGAVGLFIITQIIILWGNRGMVTVYTQAQRKYLDENFEAARKILEKEHATGKTDFRTLTLLGNTYRQLGMLDASEQVLLEAINIAPEHHFPLYGFGRTLLMQGRYTEASEVLERALSNGAPPIVELDFAEALYRGGMHERARAVLQTTKIFFQEPYRALMAAYLLYRLGENEQPKRELREEGLAYWIATAERFRHTAYGQSLVEDVHCMQMLAEGRHAC